MPTFTHEVTINGFARLIYEGLASMGRGTPEEEEFKSRIVNCGAGIIKPKRGTDTHEPDSYFVLDDLRYGLAIEVAYSQKSEKLEDLARFYIFESMLNTQKVIGVFIDYNRSKRVTLHTWQRETTTSDMLRHHSQVSILAIPSI